MYRMGEQEIEELRCVILAKQLHREGDPAQGHRQEVAEFEREWAQKIGTRYALCLSGGGTAALICALAGLGIGPGDEVIVPGYTFMATASSVLAVGAIPVIAEVDETLTIDPADVEKKISADTRAIIPVHMVGRPAEMGRLCDIALSHGLRLVEDACQAVGGSFRGRRLGSWGDAGAFSFNYYKVISCGEGGAMVTHEYSIYERALIYHDGGADFRPYARNLESPVFLGLQLRADEIMGAILRMQLRRLDGILQDLRKVRKRLEEELADARNIRIAPNNDPEGDCGIEAAFQFASEARARAFAASPGVHGWLPIDSGKHVYSNWGPVLGKRVGHHPDVNPFYHPRNQGLRTNYSADMCPRTLDILSRTVLISLNPDWQDAEIRERVDACRKAAKVLS